MGPTAVRFPLEQAILLCVRLGNQIDLDYIYRGLEDRLGPAYLRVKDAPDRPGFVPPLPPRRRG